MSEKLLTPSEVAARWDVHRATVLRLFHSGVLPGVTVSGGRARVMVRFRPETILAWEKRRERGGDGRGMVEKDASHESRS
jgi:excisionase family DNA binding protein